MRLCATEGLLQAGLQQPTLWLLGLPSPHPEFNIGDDVDIPPGMVNILVCCVQVINDLLMSLVQSGDLSMVIV